MAEETVFVFRPFDFEVGQKITIQGGPRRGDWEVIGCSERKVKLKCPITHKEVEWDRFCYLLGKSENEKWPHDD